MSTQRIRGLHSTLFLAQCVLVIAVLYLSMGVTFAFFTEASTEHREHYPLYAAVLISGLIIEFLVRNPERLVASSYERSFLKQHNLSFRQTLISIGVLFLYLAATKDAYVSRTVLAFMVPLLYLVLLASNLILPRLLAGLFLRPSRMERALILGSSSRLKRLLPWLNAKRSFGFRVVGLLSDEGEMAVPGVPCLGRYDSLEKTLAEYQVSLVIFLGLPDSAQAHEHLVESIESFGARILILSDLEERLRHRVVHVEDDGLSFIAPRSEPLEYPLNRMLKRALDISIALPVVVFVLPVIGFAVWICHRWQSPGPLFFRQVRAGIQNREFHILKFRSMHPKTKSVVSVPGQDEHRVFTAGKLLRRLSLDEIPQFINVLAGDMSVCGPRPHLIEHNELFAQKMARYSLRAFVRPGVTGLAQVRGFRGDVKNLEDIEYRLQSDISYIENWRLLLDVAIIFRTAVQMVLFAGDGILRRGKESSAVQAAEEPWAPLPVTPAAALRTASASPDYRHILGVRFFNGSVEEAVSIGMEGGLVVAPSAPVLLGLEKDPVQRVAVRGSSLAITDSGFMVLIWKLLTGEELNRVSGLAYLKLLLQQPEVKAPGATYCIMPSEESARHHAQWLRKRGFALADEDLYVAASGGMVEDADLVQRLRERRPVHIVMAVGGGIQEKLGAYLLRELDYMPAVHCTGAAIGILSGEQASIPSWADYFYLGWFFHCLNEPSRFLARYWEARRLAGLMLRYHGRMPGAKSEAIFPARQTERPTAGLAFQEMLPRPDGVAT